MSKARAQRRLSSDLFFVDRRDPRLLQVQLAASIVGSILDSSLQSGSRMPSTRQLATHLGVSRLTVTLVYQELCAQGYLEPRPRSAFVISDAVPHRRLTSSPHRPAVAELNGVDWGAWLGCDLNQRRRITKPRSWRSYPYPFIYGQVDPALFDHAAWRDCARRALGAREFRELADDRMAEDDPVLVDYICRNTLPRRGIRARPEEVLITLGAQNAIWIAAHLLARPDRLTVLEEPGFPDFAETLRFLGMPICAVRVDADGLDPALLPGNARLVMVTPSHHVPTGVTMPVERRRELLRLAEERDMLVIEDDYEYEMSFLEPPSPSLKSLDRAGRVIYVGSFSKSLFPGLRIGYLVASEEFIQQARALRALMLRHAPGHMQRVTGYFLALGHYDAHLQRLREAFRKRRETLIEALRGSPLSVVGAPRHGGSSIWVEGPDYLDSAEFAHLLKPEGVLIEPGHPFFDQPPTMCRAFRLGYSSISEGSIGPGVEIMRRVAEAGHGAVSR